MGVGRSRRAALTLTTTGAVLLVLVAAASGRREGVAQNAAPPQPQPCKTTVGARSGVTTEGTAMPEPLCGTKQADRLTAVGGGDSLWGYQGRDTLRAKNAKPDLIYGGPDADTGTFDRCDRVFEVEKMTVAPAACPGVTERSLAAAAQEAPLPSTSPVLGCEDRPNPSDRWRVRLIRQPTMRAIDATAEIDWQFVAFQARLWRLEGERWVSYQRHSWLWDMTYDRQVEAFVENYWRRFTDNERARYQFNVTEPGTYRVSVGYHWYAGLGAPEREIGKYATNHYGRYSDPTQRMCVFPEPAASDSPPG